MSKIGHCPKLRYRQNQFKLLHKYLIFYSIKHHDSIENSYTEQFEELDVGFWGELVPLAVKCLVLHLTGTVLRKKLGESELRKYIV
jgi:hypothetical protein